MSVVSDSDSDKGNDGWDTVVADKDAVKTVVYWFWWAADVVWIASQAQMNLAIVSTIL